MNKLNEMLQKQYELQLMYGKKRGTITPDSTDVKARINEAIYYFGCMCAELQEMMEEIDTYNITESVKEESIDVFHFLMNVILYIGPKNVEIDYEIAYPRFEHDICDARDAYLLNIADLCLDFGELINNIPYKNWKTYPEIVIYGDKIMLIIEKMIRHFFIIPIRMKISRDEFYELYCKKNNINRERQDKGY